MNFENVNTNYGKPSVQFFVSNKGMIAGLSV